MWVIWSLCLICLMISVLEMRSNLSLVLCVWLLWLMNFWKRELIRNLCMVGCDIMGYYGLVVVMKVLSLFLLESFLKFCIVIILGSEFCMKR